MPAPVSPYSPLAVISCAGIPNSRLDPLPSSGVVTPLNFDLASGHVLGTGFVQ